MKTKLWMLPLTIICLLLTVSSALADTTIFDEDFSGATLGNFTSPSNYFIYESGLMKTGFPTTNGSAYSTDYSIPESSLGLNITFWYKFNDDLDILPRAYTFVGLAPSSTSAEDIDTCDGCLGLLMDLENARMYLKGISTSYSSSILTGEGALIKILWYYNGTVKGTITDEFDSIKLDVSGTTNFTTVNNSLKVFAHDEFLDISNSSLIPDSVFSHYDNFLVKSICQNDFICTSYDACAPTDTKECTAAVDNSSCGEDYTGDYSELIGVCDYGTDINTTGFTTSDMTEYRSLDTPYIQIDDNFRISWLGNALDFNGADFNQYATFEKGELSSGSVPVTEGHGVSFSVWGDSTAAGVKVSFNSGLTINSLTLSSGLDVTYCHIDFVSGGNVATATGISGQIATFTPTALLASTEYYIYCGGGSQQAFVLTSPVATTNINWLGGYYGGPDPDYFNNIESLTFDIVTESYNLTSSRWVNVESSNLASDVNTTAQITFYDVTGLDTPSLTVNDILCSACTLDSYDGTDAIFTVPHFTNYTLQNGTACTPDWVCNSYDNCTITDVTPCLNVTDNNSCNESFTGNLSDYDGTCDYCTPDWVCNSYGECNVETQSQDCDSVADLELCGEGYTGNYTEFPSQGCYVPGGYQARDLSKIVIDFLGGFGVFMISFVAIIAIIWLFGWLLLGLKTKEMWDIAYNLFKK